MKCLTIFAFFLISLTVSGQEIHGRKHCEKCDRAYHFRDVSILEHTQVKQQISPGSYWSYAACSFLESEMMRMGKRPYDLSPIYVMRSVLTEKAETYVSMHGAITWDGGCESHDVLNAYNDYGLMPEVLYSGIEKGACEHSINDMFGEVKNLLDKVIEHPYAKKFDSWKDELNNIFDHYLGEAPRKFNFDARNFSAVGFAQRIVGVHPEDYIELASFANEPNYKEIKLKFPANWAFNRVHNVKLDDITDIIDHAIGKGFTVLWNVDVSEPYFGWDFGIAYVPEKDFSDMTPQERHGMWDEPKDEKYVSAYLRQLALDNLETTEDHAMHIIGVAEDRNHKKYYKVKNSWGKGNDYDGYIYVTKTYVRYKTTTILLHKSGLSTEMRNRLNLGIIQNY